MNAPKVMEAGIMSTFKRLKVGNGCSTCLGWETSPYGVIRPDGPLKTELVEVPVKAVWIAVKVPAVLIMAGTLLGTATLKLLGALTARTCVLSSKHFTSCGTAKAKRAVRSISQDLMSLQTFEPCVQSLPSASRTSRVTHGEQADSLPAKTNWSTTKKNHEENDVIAEPAKKKTKTDQR